MLLTGWGGLPLITGGQSRAINGENPRGEKGRGGTAASNLGPSRKGSPCLSEIQSGETAVLGEIEGPGVIQHIWITVTDRTSDADCFVLRDLVFRIYWDGEEKPSVEAPLGDFFCCGFGQGCLVNSLPWWWPPTGASTATSLCPSRRAPRSPWKTSTKTRCRRFFFQIDYCLQEVPENAGYFHAQWRRQRLTEKARDYVVLDNVHGRGQYVGTIWP